jgi:uncharacterized protein with FMN-binding domain
MPNALRTEPGGFDRVPRRGAVALVTTTLAVLLLFGFKTGDQPGLLPVRSPVAVIGAPGRSTPGPTTVGASPPPTPVPGRPGSTATPATPPPAGTAPAGASGTFTGDAIDTPYGTVQVAVVMKAGKIVDVQALQMPFDRRLSQQISQQSEPLLRSQVLKAQSARINGVSGASYTSEGYFESLQSALAQVP